MKFNNILFGYVLLTMSHSLAAHHSTAMFDQTQVKEFTGTVKEFQFTNPHSWIQIFNDENGEQVEWSLEWDSPNRLAREGVRPAMFSPGAEVTIRIYPMKDGAPAGLFIGARFADGSTVGRWEE
tara:strand:- start:391 stop:762 length:372 start_codon:yes stop_codon:yes gene_type:complete